MKERSQALFLEASAAEFVYKYANNVPAIFTGGFLPEAGGGTTFPDVHVEVAPIKGNAVFFSYDRPHPMTRTLHGGAPVIEGEKWVATKWMRQGRFD